MCITWHWRYTENFSLFDFRPHILSPCAKMYRFLILWKWFIKYISKQTLQSKLLYYGSCHADTVQ